MGDPLRRALEEKLGGQYRILRLLGRGGMGAVYLARDLTLEREVAIKVVTPASGGAGIYDRFRREAKTAAKLSHPNVVPLHSFGNVDGMPYFVMGFVRGESLADRLRREGKVPEADARRILAEVADALDHAHRQGVVHRDVKPDNVLIEDASGRALLMDFGIARSMQQNESLTQEGSVVGTPHYMSPEQAAGRADIDGRSDIYSLGVMGFAMLSGRLPFEGASAASVLAKHLTQEAPPLRSFAPTVSESTQQAIERCLAKDPAKRWPDARALRLSLGVVEDAELPVALEALHGRGLPFLLIAALLLLFVWRIVIVGQGAPREVFALFVGGAVAGCAAVVISLRREGFPMRLVQRVLWTEPSWWPFWYPRALRRRFNVWDRLPASVRRLRMAAPLIAIAAALTIFAALEVLMETLVIRGVVLLALVLVTGILEFLANRELRLKGIQSGIEQDRINIRTSLSRARFWNQPHIARVLAAPAGVESHRSDSPVEQMNEIVRIAGDLSGPLRSLGSDAAAAARRLVDSIAASDRRLLELSRNIDPGEEQRLVEKINALQRADAASPVRELLEKQLQLLRGFAAVVEEEKTKRNRHIEMLRTLALHMASLHVRAAETPAHADSLSANVRAICDQISEQGFLLGQDTPTVPHPRAESQ